MANQTAQHLTPNQDGDLFHTKWFQWVIGGLIIILLLTLIVKIVVVPGLKDLGSGASKVVSDTTAVHGDTRDTLMKIVNDEILGTDNYSTADNVSNLQFHADTSSNMTTYYTYLDLSYRGGAPKSYRILFLREPEAGNTWVWHHVFQLQP